MLEMENEIKIAWSVPKSSDFDLKQFATGILEIAMENLQRDRTLASAAFIVTADQIRCVQVDFADHQEKVVSYRALVSAARATNALALITCNDAFWNDNAGKDYMESYYPGKMAAEGSKECIMLTVSGPGIRTWVAEVSYERTETEILFGELQQESGGDLGMLEGWASDDPAIQ
jgi:hypothetical protein